MKLDNHMQKIIARGSRASRSWKETMKSLLNYFSVVPKSSPVPDPNGPLSKTMSPSTIATVNWSYCWETRHHERKQGI